MFKTPRNALRSRRFCHAPKIFEKFPEFQKAPHHASRRVEGIRRRVPTRVVMHARVKKNLMRLMKITLKSTPAKLSGQS